MLRDEAVVLLVEAIRDLSAERRLRLDAERDRDAFRLLAQVALSHAHTLQHANEGLLRALAAIRRDERQPGRKVAA